MDKSNDDAPNGIEKQIGFEGISDKASGFYCYYHEGRVVEKEEEGMGTRGSGFKAIKGKQMQKRPIYSWERGTAP